MSDQRQPPVGAPSHSASELALVELAERFSALNGQIDALVTGEDSSDPQFLALHKQWEDACCRAAAISAETREGQRAKAGMLLIALDVIVPPKTERELHEQLAASLAHDVIGSGRRRDEP